MIKITLNKGTNGTELILEKVFAFIKKKIIIKIVKNKL